jgi:regulatory protein
MVAVTRETKKRPRRQPGPLDAAGLESAALRYLERFQTTRARLSRLLSAKLRQRGWASASPPDIAALVERLAALGYIDEAAFAAARVRSGSTRGQGARRLQARLGADGIAPEEAAAALAGHDALAAAIRHARRRRLGPFGPPSADRASRARQVASLVRAGHSPGLAWQIVTAASAAELDGLDAGHALADEAEGGMSDEP